MYLAEILVGSRKKYIIRESRYNSNNNCYEYHNIFDLGSKPQDFIQTFGEENYVSFDQALEDEVSKSFSGDSTALLEELLFDYLPEEEQKRSQHFSRKKYNKLRPLSEDEKMEIANHVHIFDRRRLYYIRYGAVDQGRVFRVSEKLYKPLMYMGRDEKEYYLRKAERSLSPTEYKKYVYSIFNLQQEFDEIYSSFMPEALEQEKVEDFFVLHLCLLNSDLSFWAGMESGQFLHPHLQRYLLFFFDFSYENRSFDQEFINIFRARHRSFKWPEAVVNDEAISEIFGEKMSTLKKMGTSELARIFRIKALEHHPDQGGDSEKFILLQEAYESLRKKINKTK